MNLNRLLRTVVMLSVALLLVVFYVFVHWHETLERKLGTEVFKSTYQYLLQFLLIAVLGGLVTYLYTVLAKDREAQANERAKERDKLADERRTQQELRQKFYDEYIEIVYEAIKVRYLLGAKAVRADQVDHQPYDELMQRLLNVTTGLASLNDKLESDTVLYSPIHDSLVENLKKVTSYFNDVINEYWSAWKHFKGDPPQASCKDLKALDEFLNVGGDQSPFMRQFKEPNDCVRKALQKLLLSNQV
jgi:hypothetical protein